ncbi:ABC transporter ATP-binding protein [Paenibacillus sp. J2TS4]|uniref:ABC transporter ATP-binding protein n=1 Tax=Paenibacillus sp. J2TS4 TaxID=2807194 RepID=UPI001B29B1B1|nr:ABC transporter ATP-binding protein [Paenibacillus sp. J2TS4]GIP34694.1 ATP-binding protein [Paenibacillus sp. J2TS4]
MIEVSSLTYAYAGSRTNTIKGVDFHISRGEIFGFLGPSGAGKSTIQKILIGVLKQYGGSVRVMGRELRQAKADYFERIGVAFEFPNFYSRFTALENLNFFRSLYSCETEEPKRLLARVGLEDYGREKVSGFSKGMKMRLNLCRALMNRPEVLFLDEPTSGLDPVNAKLVKELIVGHKAEGKTVLLTTHNMNAAEELCDRVAFIVDGQIPLIDSPRELKLRQGVKKLVVEYKENDERRTEEFSLKCIGRNSRFLNIIRDKPIETMHSQEATLEHIFIDVTGRKLD